MIGKTRSRNFVAAIDESSRCGTPEVIVDDPTLNFVSGLLSSPEPLLSHEPWRTGDQEN
jgi:hypothetical protein